MSSSRKSVKDHLLKRDVARAEGGETSPYTIHLRQMGKKKSHESPTQSDQADNPPPDREAGSSPRALQSPATQESGRDSSAIPSPGPRAARPQGDRLGGPFGNQLSLFPQNATIHRTHACQPSSSPRPRPSNSRVDDGHEMHQPQHHEEHEAEQGHSLLGQVQQRHPPARWPGPARSGRRGQRCRGRRTRGPPGAGRGPRVEGGRGRAGGAAGVRTEGAGRACAPPAARRALGTTHPLACARWCVASAG